MSDMDKSSDRGSFFGKKGYGRFLVLCGDCELINEYLYRKADDGSAFVLLWYINSVLRSFGYVIFANNPISGFIIMASILSADSTAGLAAILCSTISFLFALILKQDSLGNLNGFFGYNAVLLGTFSAGLLPRIYPAVSVDEPKFWLFLIFITVVSVYVTSATTNFLRYLGRHPIPCFLLPFNFLQYILIFCLLNNSVPPTVIGRHLLRAPGLEGGNRTVAASSPSSETANESPSPPLLAPDLYDGGHGWRRPHSAPEELAGGTGFRRNAESSADRNSSEIADFATLNETRWKWGEVFSGTVVSVCQIYGLDRSPGSASFVLLALVLYSPTTALFCYAGSVTATLFGTAFASHADEIYGGLWGYNGFLCGGALAGFGFVLTAHSVLLTLGAVLFSTVLQHYLTPLFLTFDVPIFTAPFNLTAILFLFVTSDSEAALSRPANFSFPEKHRYEFGRRIREESEDCTGRERVTDAYASKSEV